ncbi:flagellar hook-length control protein FliK [Vagococcus sp. WN89Y]|uniref:flagellar hook-length control protein FliK n=1 Tax=Vagococcus sp. WN89Y TaxID=3457258 RepID=UPI003FCDF3F2
MIIKNTPVPTADAGRKTPQAGATQNNDHFASELKKQMSSGHQPQTQKAEEKSNLAPQSKKQPAQEKTQPEEDDALATLPTLQTDPLTMLLDGSALPAPAVTLDAQATQAGPEQQPVTQEALISGLQIVMPAPVQAPVAQSEAVQALVDGESPALPVQASAVMSELQKPQAAAVNTAPDRHPGAVAESVSSKGERAAIQPDVTQAQTSPEMPKETSAKPASFGENIAAAMNNMNNGEPVAPQSQAYSAPVIPASVATATPAMPAIPTASVATGTLQAEVGTPAWQHALGQQIAVFSRNGIHHAELRLHPEDLGALQVSLKVNNEQAQVHFVAESQHVRAALESAMPHLRTMLAESGIQLGQSSVGADTASSSGAAFSGNFSGQKNSGQESGEPGVLAEDERISQPVVIKYSSGINTFA